jgi:phospholipase C
MNEVVTTNGSKIARPLYFPRSDDSRIPYDVYSSPTMVSSDDHSPSSIAGGQSFLRKVYCALKKNKSRWDRSLMIVMYDENGGFFDHQSPLPIHTNPGAS